MKKTSFLYLSLAAIVVGSFASCQDEELGYTKEEIAYSRFEKEYNENFEREYGKIAPGHTWGFGSNAKTRSADQPTRYKIVRQPGYVDLPNNQKEYFSVDPQHQSGGASTIEERQYAGRNCPPVVSEEEKAYVFAYLRKYPNGGSTTCALDNYFMQDLHQDPTPDVTHGTEHCPGWGYINNLYFDGVHFNDYNGTAYSPDYYVVHTNIVNPSYQDSYGTSGDSGPARENRYRFYYIPVDPTVTPAAPADFKGGYYLCFDYESTKKNANAQGEGNGLYPSIHGAQEPFGKPDGVYNDWVIKLTPGQYDRHRVLCEDLGSTHDLDFNDLVFDYTDYGDFIEVNVIALIGTLKINVTGPDGTVVPIKTVNNQQYNVNNWYTFSGSNISINDLRFSVESVGPMGQCFIANTPGKAPYMLQVPAGTQWPDEGVRIESLHPFFSEYVVSPNERPDWWNEPTIVQHSFSGSELHNVAQYIENGHEYTLIVTVSEPTSFSFYIGWNYNGDYFSGTKQFVFTGGDSFRIDQGADKVQSLILKEVISN